MRSRNSPTDTALPGIKTMGSKLLTGCGAILLALVPAVATAREISPSSSSIFDRSGHQSQPPLAVLRIGGPSGGDQDVPPPELEIFAEDPRWAYKVRGSQRVVNVEFAAICIGSVSGCVPDGWLILTLLPCQEKRSYHQSCEGIFLR